MKALSMKQPVPELILNKRKTIETRTWKSDFRGEFYIHASNNLMQGFIDKFSIDESKLIKGAIVGKASIIDMKVYNTVEDFKLDSHKHLMDIPNKLPTYGYILDNIKRLDNPIKLKGKLNFFEVDFDEKQN